MRRLSTTRTLVVAVVLAADAVALPTAKRGSPPTADLAVEPAPSSEPEVSAARDAFREGSALARQGKWSDALTAFQRSAVLKPHPITTYDIAYCERALGRYARASFHFEEALTPPAEPGGSALPPELSSEARKYLDEVKARIVRIAITLDRDNLTLRVDGRPLEKTNPLTDAGPYLVGDAEGPPPTLPGRAFELWLDPGTHVFVVSGEGSARSVESHSFGEGAHASLHLATVTPPPPAQATRAETKPVAPAPSNEPAPNRTAAWVALGIGGAALVTSGVFTGLALSAKSGLDSEPQCKNRICPPSYEDRESRMRTFADIATVGVVAGSVGVALGAYLFFTATPARTRAHFDPSERRSRQASPIVTPYFAGTAGGIAGVF